MPPNPLLESAFNFDRGSNSPVDFIDGMMVRAVLLLRFATGSCLDLRDAAGKNVGQLVPWIDSLSLARGVWQTGKRPIDTFDLWENLVELRNDLESITSPDRHEALMLIGEGLIPLGQMERVMAWNF